MSLVTPQQVIDRLEAIDADLACRQGELEDAAMNWFRRKRDREHDWAVAFSAADGTDTRRKAQANRETSHIGAVEEGRWEGLRAVVRVLETRASIAQSVLRAQGRS